MFKKIKNFIVDVIDDLTFGIRLLIIAWQEPEREED